jgi:serine/threonine-protein kinase
MIVPFRRFINSHPQRSGGSLPLALPYRLGDYRLTRAIGRGSLSRVYLGERLGCWPPSDADHRCVAVKVLREKWHSRDRVIEQFAIEATVLREVKHPNLIGLTDAQTEETPHHLVMPLVSGQSLASWKTSPTRPRTADALRWTEHTAAALAALDEHGWMHSDIKPSNVLVDAHGNAVLIDLGFARRTNHADEDARPLAGTLNYMAPEWFTRSDPPEIRSDVYSLGILLFELLTGRLPFDGKTAIEVIGFHRNGTARHLSEFRPDVPGSIGRLLEHMLLKRPGDRPRPDEVVRQLRRQQFELPSQSGWISRAA